MTLLPLTLMSLVAFSSAKNWSPVGSWRISPAGTGDFEMFGLQTIRRETLVVRADGTYRSGTYLWRGRWTSDGKTLLLLPSPSKETRSQIVMGYRHSASDPIRLERTPKGLALRARSPMGRGTTVQAYVRGQAMAVRGDRRQAADEMLFRGIYIDGPTTVEGALRDGADPSDPDPAMFFLDHEVVTPIYDAVRCHSLATARLLLSRGAETNVFCTSKGITPLMLAARHGRLDFIRLLRRYHADPRLKNRKGLTAADFANEAPNPAAVRAELERSTL